MGNPGQVSGEFRHLTGARLVCCKHLLIVNVQVLPAEVVDSRPVTHRDAQRRPLNSTELIGLGNLANAVTWEKERFGGDGRASRWLLAPGAHLRPKLNDTCCRTASSPAVRLSHLIDLYQVLWSTTCRDSPARTQHVRPCAVRLFIIIGRGRDQLYALRGIGRRVPQHLRLHPRLLRQVVSFVSIKWVALPSQCLQIGEPTPCTFVGNHVQTRNKSSARKESRNLGQRPVSGAIGLGQLDQCFFCC